MIRLIAIILLALVSGAQAQNTETFQNYMSSRASATSITGLQQFLVLQNNQVRLGSLAQIGAGIIVSNITRAQIATSTIGGNIIVTNGFSTVGDAGAGCIYSTVGASANGLMNINDSTGQHWNLVPNHTGASPGGELGVGCFGAKQDQVTDDTVAVQAGVNWAIVNQGTLYIGNDLISSGISYTATGSNLFFNLVGTGQGPSLIATNPNFSFLTLNSGSGGSSGFDTFTIRNMHFDNTNVATVGGIGITFSGSQNPSGINHFLLDNLLFTNLGTALINNHSFGWNWGVISRFRTNNTNNGINIVHQTGTGITWQGITMQMANVSTGTGVHMGDGSGNVGDQKWNGLDGDGGAYGLDLAGGAYADYNQIYGFQWNAAANAFVRLRNMAHVVIHGIWQNGSWDIDTASLDTDLNLREHVIEVPITSTQNNYVITAWSRYEHITATTSLQITGIATGFDGRLVDVYNVSGSTITLADESSASATNNRFHLNGNATLASGQGIQLRWTNQFNRWIRVGGQ